ncbi:MAG: hypothetical protein WC919_01725 [Candidatus Paceibacterota bacterium]|jgi:hypothetical protein|nr:hypothetical protein [Candidatus Paceibacterota bacterium]
MSKGAVRIIIPHGKSREEIEMEEKEKLCDNCNLSPHECLTPCTEMEVNRI